MRDHHFYYSFACFFLLFFFFCIQYFYCLMLAHIRALYWADRLFFNRMSSPRCCINPLLECQPSNALCSRARTYEFTILTRLRGKLDAVLYALSIPERSATIILIIKCNNINISAAKCTSVRTPHTHTTCMWRLPVIDKSLNALWLYVCMQTRISYHRARDT